jgi:putative PIG3 family NAD(P)H quinone oxidoreductase
MRAVRVGGGPDFPLQWVETPTPSPGPGEVRISVRAAGVNRADLLQRAGLYPPPPGASTILGLECAGTISAVGKGIATDRIGEPVCALLSGGGYAEEVVCPAAHLLPIPKGLSFSEAASLPEAWATVWLKLVVEGKLEADQRVVLHAGASGIGTAAIQLCQQRGNPCFVTVGNKAKLAACVALGAETGAVRHDGDWLPAVKSWSPLGADLILDPVGASYLKANLRALQPGGRLVIMGLLGGRTAEVDLGILLVKRLKLVGSTLRSRSDQEKNQLLTSLQNAVWPDIEKGTIKTVISHQFNIKDVEAAHRVISLNATTGKVVLLVE